MGTRYLDILADWNFWGRKMDTGVKRKVYLGELLRWSAREEVVAVSGVRRAGKSTILRQLGVELNKKEKVPLANTLYINFEDPRLGEELKAVDLFPMYEEFLQKLKPKGRVYVFLDEVQKVAGWERFVRTLYDQKKNVKFFVTGSNSTVFSSKLTTVLTGRMKNILVYPLSFAEYQDFADWGIDEYLRFGGFPEVVLEKDEGIKRELLMAYYQNILENDVILRNGIKNKGKVKKLAVFLLSNAGNLVSSYALEKTLEVLNADIGRYLDYLEEAYLIVRVPLFSYSVKKQIYNPDKVFCVDTGLANIAGFAFSENKGRLLENVVFNKLMQDRKKVFYWKNGTEIDFALQEGTKVTDLINVTTTVDDMEVKKRELESLAVGAKEFPGAKTTLLSLYNQSGQPDSRSLTDFLLA